LNAITDVQKIALQLLLKSPRPLPGGRITRRENLKLMTFVLATALTVLALPSHAAPAASGATAAKTKPAPAADPLKGLVKNYDKMRGITWYQSPAAPKYRNANAIYLYFGKEDDGSVTPLRLAAQYYSDDWLFVTRAWAKAGKTRVDIPQKEGLFGWERDHGSGNIWEWSDIPVLSSTDKASVRVLSEATDVTVRYEGKQYYNDKKLSAKQLKALRDTIVAYEAVSGKPWK
jgi:hypothetical protein